VVEGGGIRGGGEDGGGDAGFLFNVLTDRRGLFRPSPQDGGFAARSQNNGVPCGDNPRQGFARRGVLHRGAKQEKVRDRNDLREPRLAPRAAGNGAGGSRHGPSRLVPERQRIAPKSYRQDARGVWVTGEGDSDS